MKLAFGGPDLPPRALRDLLQQQVDDSPPGSRIDWATYYFRDRALASSLMRASDRGVQVRLALEARPRLRDANMPVAEMLASHGLGGGFHLRKGGAGSLHAKIYAFSEPRIAWVGSFNPSGDEPEDSKVIAEIGDQDRGHNLLLGLTGSASVQALVAYVGRLSRWRGLFDRFRPGSNRVLKGDDALLCFYPRVRTRLVEREIDALGSGDRLLGAVSHLKGGPLCSALIAAIARGADVTLLVHDTERRVPSAILQRLRQGGVAIERVADPHGLPMHAKFLLIERRGLAAAWLGSFNYNPRSRWLNDELLVRTEDAGVTAALAKRFDEIKAGA